MKDLNFAGKRFAQAFGLVFIVLASAYMLRGQAAPEAARDAAIWAVIGALLFAGRVMYNRKKNNPCGLCRDAAD